MEWISKVELSEISNTSNARCYSNFMSKPTNLQSGYTYSIKLTPGFSGSSRTEYWKAWIDFNGNGSFLDAGENVLTAQGSSVVSGMISIPSGLQARTTRMRVAMSGDGYPPSGGGFSSGEAEDYTVYLNTTSYPSSYGQSQQYEYIKRVKINAIDNTSAAQCYSDYCGISTDLKRGEYYSITLTPGFTGYSYTERWRVWIDYNNDGDFLDANEKVVERYGNSAITTYFRIPNEAEILKVRMRVSMRGGSSYYPSASGAFSRGEVEDYTITIVP